MAVEDKYFNTDYRTGKLVDAKSNGGSSITPYIVSDEIEAADDDGSIYRLVTVGSNITLYELQISNDAITGGTDYDIGLYLAGVGNAAVDADVFADGLDLSSAGDKVNGLTAPDIANLGKPLWEILGLSEDPKVLYDIAVTGNTVGTAAGTITVHLQVGV